MTVWHSDTARPESPKIQSQKAQAAQAAQARGRVSTKGKPSASFWIGRPGPQSKANLVKTKSGIKDDNRQSNGHNITSKIDEYRHQERAITEVHGEESEERMLLSQSERKLKHVKNN